MTTIRASVVRCHVWLLWDAMIIPCSGDAKYLEPQAIAAFVSLPSNLHVSLHHDPYMIV